MCLPAGRFSTCWAFLYLLWACVYLPFAASGPSQSSKACRHGLPRGAQLGSQPPIAIGETVILLTLPIPIETPTEGRCGCSRMCSLAGGYNVGEKICLTELGQPITASLAEPRQSVSGPSQSSESC